MDNKLEVLQKDCEQYLKDPEISKKLKTMCDNVNASVGKVFNVGYQLVASVENATADEKKTDLYLDLLLKACDDRDTKGVNVLKIW